MMGISLKSRIPSPSRFALTVRKQSQTITKRQPHQIPSPQHLELRHTEVWTRDHLEWFNVDFDPSRFHTIPVEFSDPKLDECDILDDELLARVLSLVNEFQEIIPNPNWDCTSLSERGRQNWIEVSARPTRTMQLFVTSLINVLFTYLGRSQFEIHRNEKLKIVYAGHGIFKDKYYGVYRCEGKPVMSVETDVKYVYGRTNNVKEDVGYINAAHVFSDVLAMSQESQRSSSETCNESFTNISNGENFTSSAREVSSTLAKIDGSYSSSTSYMARYVSSGLPFL